MTQTCIAWRDLESLASGSVFIKQLLYLGLFLDLLIVVSAIG